MCKWCKAVGHMHRHSDPAKAQQGITVCDACGMAHSPNATIKGSFAYWDGKKIVTGILWGNLESKVAA